MSYLEERESTLFDGHHYKKTVQTKRCRKTNADRKRSEKIGKTGKDRKRQEIIEEQLGNNNMTPEQPLKIQIRKEQQLAIKHWQEEIKKYSDMGASSALHLIFIYSASTCRLILFWWCGTPIEANLSDSLAVTVDVFAVASAIKDVAWWPTPPNSIIATVWDTSAGWWANTTCVLLPFSTGTVHGAILILAIDIINQHC